MDKWTPIFAVGLFSMLGLASLGVFIIREEPRPLPELIQLSTVGPRAETPVTSDVLYLIDSQIKSVRKMGLKAAVVLHDTKSDYSRVLVKGLKHELANLDIDLIYLSDAGNDPYIERLQLIKALLQEPDILITLPLNQDALSYYFKLASERNTSVAILNNLPAGLNHPKDYAGVVTDDLFQMGRYAAEMIASNIKGGGKVAVLYHASPDFVTNQRDKALETVLEHRYPSIKVVAREGINSIEDAETKTLDILKSYPDVDAIYVPWAAVAKGSLAGLRKLNNKKTKLFTMNFDEELSKDMVNEGNVGGFVVDYPYDIGTALVRVAVLAKLGEPTPALTTVRAEKVDKTSLVIRWREIQHEEVPDDIMSEFK
ncbi:substrate-binding domain-containing protein [Kiloniella sp.]|uniref:substrate-binding domain-containing protein n=1 Tax=Kiloniella sp. TaxID=1938587 RepID=UPI003B02EB8B